jgi:hypothetical protein
MKSFAVVGSRTFVDIAGAEQKCLDIVNEFVVEHEELQTYINGDAKGPDRYGKKVAETYGLQIVTYKPDWAKYGKGAGFRRNELIVRDADILLIFWDGSSRGTAHDIGLCKQSNREYILYEWSWILHEFRKA